MPANIPHLCLTDVREPSVADRLWRDVPAGPAASRWGCKLLLVDVPRFLDNDPLYGGSAVMAERGHPARAVLVDDAGVVRTQPRYADSAFGIAADGGLARASRMNQVALGVRPGADFIAAHMQSLSWTEGSGWEDIALSPRPQLYVDVDGQPVMRDAAFDVCDLDISSDGTRVVFVEYRGGEDIRYILWEDDLQTGTRRFLTVLEDSAAWGIADVSYSPDAAWVLVCGGSAGTGPRLVRVCDGAQLLLPDGIESACWWPAAGPGHLLGVRSDSDTRMTLLDHDLAGALSKPVMTVESGDGQDTYLRALGVSIDGKFLVARAAIGMSREYRQEQGTGARALVIDLRSGASELVLPVSFACNVERDVTAAGWVDSDPAPGWKLDLQSDRLFPAVPLPEPNSDDVEHRAEEMATSLHNLCEAVALRGVNLESLEREIIAFAATAAQLDVDAREETIPNLAQFFIAATKQGLAAEQSGRRISDALMRVSHEAGLQPTRPPYR